MYTEEVDKIALSSNDDKRLQTFNKIRTYTYGTNAFKICKSEMLSKYKKLTLITTLMKIKQNIIQSGIYSQSSIQNINNWRLWIWKNKCIIKFNN